MIDKRETKWKQQWSQDVTLSTCPDDNNENAALFKNAKIVIDTVYLRFGWTPDMEGV